MVTKLYKFWAPWCGPCLQMKPIVEKVLATRPDIQLVEFNVDEMERDYLSTFNVSSVPTLVLDVGSKRAVKIGACSESQLAEWIDGNL